MSERRYTDEEFALILRRAAEIQARGSSVPSSRHGLTLEEIRSIAAEAGLDPEVVGRVARELSEGHVSLVTRLFGGPASYRIQFTVDRSLDEQARTAALEAIRGAMGVQGRSQRVGEALEWRTASSPSQVSVNVTPRGEHTNVQILVDRGGGVVLTGVISVLSGIAAGGIVAGILDPATVLEGVAVGGGALGTALLVSQNVWRSTTGTIKRNLSRVVEAVTAALEPPSARD